MDGTHSSAQWSLWSLGHHADMSVTHRPRPSGAHERPTCHLARPSKAWCQGRNALPTWWAMAAVHGIVCRRLAVAHKQPRPSMNGAQRSQPHRHQLTVLRARAASAPQSAPKHPAGQTQLRCCLPRLQVTVTKWLLGQGRAQAQTPHDGCQCTWQCMCRLFQKMA